MKKTLDPQANSNIVDNVDEKAEIPRVTPTTSIPSIKTNVRKMAQETIDRINNLSTIAFGEGKSSSSSNQ